MLMTLTATTLVLCAAIGMLLAGLTAYEIGVFSLAGFVAFLSFLSPGDSSARGDEPPIQ